MKVFIGSSKEASNNGLLQKIAVIVEQCQITPVKWNEIPSPFKAGNHTLENLEELTSSVDAAIFVCTEDDKTWYRGAKVGTPRDNVIFEHGLFSGKLGRKKSIIIRYGKVKLPNDLDGVTFIDFSEGQQLQGESNLRQTLLGLKGVPSGHPRISYEELEKTKSEIERELVIMKSKGIERIFNNQREAVADYKINHKSPTQPIRILCIRGESFVSNRDENWGSVILNRCNKTIVLANHLNHDLIGKRYNSNRNEDENENEFIETRRHWFTGTVSHHTGGGVNVLNVIEGDELLVESETDAFVPFVVHYAETFIIPACVGSYTIRSYGVSEGKTCGTIKAYVRFRE